MHKHYITHHFFSLLWIFMFWGSFAFAMKGKYPIKNFTPAAYEGGIQNIDFAQNRDMSLFVANNLGVLSFNGNEWKTHAARTGKKQRSLAFDEITNRLYVGSQGEFGYFEKDWKYVSLIGKIPSSAKDFDEVWDVFIVNSDVYFCTFQGIYIYDGTSISYLGNAGGFNKSFAVGNRLFTQSTMGALFEIKDFKLHTPFKQLQKNQIIAGVVQRENGFLVFYNSGKIELSTLTGVSEQYPELIRLLQGKFVNHVRQLSDSRIVIATQRAGLYLFDTKTGGIENISTKDGLQSSACLRTFQDHAGNLWVGLQNGMALIDINSPMRLISAEINIQGSGYDAFDTNEGTYYTTSNGIYFLAKNASKSVFIVGTEGPAYSIQQVSNKLYAGHHTGLFLLENGTAKRIASTEGLWQVKLLRSNPNFAVGGTYAGLYLFRINEFNELVPVQKIDGFDESSRFFEEDNKGRIWVGQFYKGLYQLTLQQELSKATVSKISDTNVLPIKEHIILSRIGEELYVSTEAGIYRIDQNTDQLLEAKIFTKMIGKPWVYLLQEGNQKNIHIVTENGVGFMKPISANNYVYVPSSLFQLRHSLNNDLLNVSVNLPTGVLYSANEGFIHFNPALEDRLINKKKPLINRVYGVAEDSVLLERLPFENKTENSEKVQLIEGLKVLQFMVESFEFKDVGNKQFRYFLKGFDEDYGQWTNATTKEYTNLKAGEYTFFVQTQNAFGENITSQPVLLYVTPPFYKTMWMKTAYTVLVLLLLLLAYKYQRQYYKGKERRLEKRKQMELSQKQNELQRVKEEQIEGELRHVNNLLGASTMNLVVKNEFMEKIKEELKEVNLKADVGERRIALNQIVKEIDKTLRVQDDWKQFEYHFDLVHGDFLTRLTSEFTDLTPGEQKLCAFLRLKMDTKEISNLMNISLRGVEIARYRLRKKFNLKTNQNLAKFVLEY